MHRAFVCALLATHTCPEGVAMLSVEAVSAWRAGGKYGVQGWSLEIWRWGIIVTGDYLAMLNEATIEG